MVKGKVYEFQSAYYQVHKCKTTLNWTNPHFSFGFFITESSDEKKIIAINFELYSG